MACVRGCQELGDGSRKESGGRRKLRPMPYNLVAQSFA
jgi:hypothetical protein